MNGAIKNHSLEKYIYPGFKIYLLSHFERIKDVTFSLERYLVEQVLTTNANMGVGKNPDFMVVAGHQPFFQRMRVDLYAFEIKKKLSEVLKDGIGQARNYRDYAHFSYVACPISDDERQSENFAELKRRCNRDKVGLIIFKNSDFPDSYEVIIQAKRKKPPEDEIEKLRKIFIAEHFEIIQKWGEVK